MDNDKKAQEFCIFSMISLINLSLYRNKRPYLLRRYQSSIQHPRIEPIVAENNR